MKNRILKAINKGIDKALILFDGEEPPIFKKSDKVGELYKDQLWIANTTVDLGLPSGTRWSKCNIGAEKPTDYGLYFLWADSAGYNKGSIKSSNKLFSKLDYKWYDTNMERYTKYNEIDKQTKLDLEDDPAYIHSDGKLISPSVELYKELYDYCDWIWTTIDGVNGYKVLSKTNDNYIFLPASGYCSGMFIRRREAGGNYWSRSLDNNFSQAYYIYFYPSTINPASGNGRYYGFSVRGVLL